MNKKEILRLNAIPDGKDPWLSYDHYQKLKQIFESVKLPSNNKIIIDRQYFQLYGFLTNTAKLQVPMNQFAVHFNAFALIRRGYKIEEITYEEYNQLLQLMDALNPADIEDMELHEFGGHRNLYNYLTKKMGFSVKKGRGPVWHRAKSLIDKYEIIHQTAH